MAGFAALYPTYELRYWRLIMFHFEMDIAAFRRTLPDPRMTV